MDREVSDLYAVPLQILADRSDLICKGDFQNIIVSSITEDSRKVEAGYLFLVRKGVVCNGELFIKEAISRGAVAIAAPDSVSEKYDVPAVILKNDFDLGRLVECFFDNPSSKLNLIGVTGTNGKTTVASFLKQILNLNNYPCGEIGTLGIDFFEYRQEGFLTTPSRVEVSAALAKMVALGLKSCVIECSSHGLRQGRLSGLSFKGAIFTNIGGDHLEYHLNELDYFSSKQKLFRMLPEKNSFAVINNDDPSGWRMATASTAPSVITTRVNSFNANVSVHEVQSDIRGTSCVLNGNWGGRRIHLPFFGEHNLSNLANAVAAANQLGLGAEDFCKTLHKLSLPVGRLERVQVEDFEGEAVRVDPCVLVDYAHTDDALENVLQSIQMIRPKGGRLVVVFGCGGDRDPSKRSRMGQVVSNYADAIYVTSDNPRNEDPDVIISQILEGIPSTVRNFTYVESNRKSAIDQAIREASPQDFLLIAGKGHEKFQEFSGAKKPFDDREVARAALIRRQLLANVIQ